MSETTAGNSKPFENDENAFYFILSFFRSEDI